MSTRPLQLLNILHDAMKSHWDHWVKEGEAVKKALDQSLDKSSSATLLKNALASIETGFEKNELFARRLFFDLPSYGKEGSNSYLASSCIKIAFDGRLKLGEFYDIESEFCEYLPS